MYKEKSLHGIGKRNLPNRCKGTKNYSFPQISLDKSLFSPIYRAALHHNFYFLLFTFYFFVVSLAFPKVLTLGKNSNKFVFSLT